MKRVALAAAISLATLTVAALLWRFRDAAILLALSVVLAAAARPAIEGLEQRVGRSFAVALSYLLGLTLFGVFAYLVSRGVLHELDDGRRAAERRVRSAPPAGGRVPGVSRAADRPPAARGGAVSRHRGRAPHPAARPGAGPHAQHHRRRGADRSSWSRSAPTGAPAARRSNGSGCRWCRRRSGPAPATCGAGSNARSALTCAASSPSACCRRCCWRWCSGSRTCRCRCCPRWRPACCA